MNVMPKKILVLSAHDDDVFIGVGGILLLRHKEDEIRVQVFTNGQNSHVVVLNVHELPSPEQVEFARKQELEAACRDFVNAGLNLTCNQWFYPDTCGELTKKKDEVKGLLTKLITSYAPDIIYFHASDAHEDHRLVSCATNEAMKEINYHGKAVTFSIWTHELARQRPEVDARLIPDLDSSSEVVDIGEVLFVKKRALHRFTSQVQIWPYLEWQPQKSPILDKGFLDYFLRGEEIITPVK